MIVKNINDPRLPTQNVWLSFGHNGRGMTEKMLESVASGAARCLLQFFDGITVIRDSDAATAVVHGRRRSRRPNNLNLNRVGSPTSEVCPADLTGSRAEPA